METTGGTIHTFLPNTHAPVGTPCTWFMAFMQGPHTQKINVKKPARWGLQSLAVNMPIRDNADRCVYADTPWGRSLVRRYAYRCVYADTPLRRSLWTRRNAVGPIVVFIPIRRDRGTSAAASVYRCIDPRAMYWCARAVSAYRWARNNPCTGVSACAMYGCDGVSMRLAIAVSVYQCARDVSVHRCEKCLADPNPKRYETQKFCTGPKSKREARGRHES